jgi:hypothetical protein
MRIELILAAAIVALFGGLGMATAQPGDKTERVYEMRTYFSPPGKLDELHARFRDHTMKLFEKHGITNVGYWVPIDNKENKLVYVLSYPSKDAATKSWKDFMGDADWQKAYKASEANGTLVKKVESRYMKMTDYSPKLPTSIAGEHVFELRVYDTTPGNLANLDARFRDHTIKLFDKHGMTNLVYWHLIPGQKKADETLVYMLAHKSEAAGKASFDAFRTDPDWVAARTASEVKGGGSLTTKDGVHSTYMKATDYSPLK